MAAAKPSREIIEAVAELFLREDVARRIHHHEAEGGQRDGDEKEELVGVAARAQRQQGAKSLPRTS